jgi:probable phosphomutase (TIGR03848 family)
MTTFYFVRHASHSLLGKTMAGRMPGVDLSEEGRAEAEELAARMQSIKLDLIYSSPLERCRQTAAPLAASLGLEVHCTDALNEVDFGDWTGMNLDQLHHVPEWSHWNGNRSCTRPPSGEMMVEIQQRVVTKVETLRYTHPDLKIALFSHSDTIRAALAYYLGMPVDLMCRLEISPASVSIVCLDEFRPTVLLLNATGALH